MVNGQNKIPILYPINANPLHMGHMIVINLLLTFASELHIVLYDRTTVITPQESKLQLDAIFAHYTDGDKITVSICKEDFTKLSEIPEQFCDDKKVYSIATTSKHVYANLIAKGYPYLMFISRPTGWRDRYYTTAFIRSIALHNVEMRAYKVREINGKKKKGR